MGIAVLVAAVLLILVLAVLWRLKPTRFRLSLKLTRWFHLEMESESTTPPKGSDA